MSAPGIGGPSDEHRAVCVYTGLSPADTWCSRSAVVHVLTLDDWHGLVALASCDQHADIARQAGRYRAEHPHQNMCGLPGTIWTDEECVIDDSGVEPTLAGARELEAVR